MPSSLLFDAAPRSHPGALNLWLSNHPVVAELLVTGAYALAFVVGLSWRWSWADNTLRTVLMLNGIIVLTSLLLRRQSPTVAAIVGIICPLLFTELLAIADSLTEYDGWGLYVGPGAYPFDIVAPLILIFGVATYRRPSFVWSVTAIAVICASACLWVTGHSERGSLVMILISTMAYITSAFAGQNLRTSRLRMEELEQRNRQVLLERDQREQLAVTTERNRIAREMHDVVAHSLAVMVTIADGAEATMEKNPQLAQRAIHQLAQTGREALADTRRLVGVLRDDSLPSEKSIPQGVPPDSSISSVPLSPQPVAEDVSDLVAQFKRTGLPIHFRQEGAPLPEDSGLHLAIYRIIQESLTNILKYAPATPRIEVLIKRQTGRCDVMVTNEPGQEGTIGSGSNKGLIGMRERAAVFNGTVQAGPYRGGWRVHAKLYWDEES